MTDSTSNFKTTLDRIEKEIESYNSCVSTMTIVSIAFPFVVWLMLYFFNPKFVRTDDKRSNKKTILWTIGITLIAWALFYCFSYCKGYVGSFLCYK